jgi:mannose-6-phosphate isomerase-like protein (cupin superfamily)
MKDQVPSVTRLSDVQTEIGADGAETRFVSTECWDLGLYFMEPGMTTIVFSTEEEDDATADEWYGWAYEFYCIVQGEFTVWYGKKADDVRRRKSPKLLLRQGDVASYPPNWKYMVQNTSKIPGSFFWGKTAPLRGVNQRLIPFTRKIK